MVIGWNKKHVVKWRRYEEKQRRQLFEPAEYITCSNDKTFPQLRITRKS